MDQKFTEEKSESSIDNDLQGSHSSFKSNKTDKSSVSGSLKYEKNSSHFKTDEGEQQKQCDTSLKVPHKIILNWRSACDRTKDKTKDLLKRWRTLPEFEADKKIEAEKKLKTNNQESCGWSVHVWTTWVDRFSVDSTGEGNKNVQKYRLTPVQINKLSHFFVHLLDHDQDNLINEQDFEKFIERLRHFADWSISSLEYNVLKEIEIGFIETFLDDTYDETMGFKVNDIFYLTKEGWLMKWSEMLNGSKTLNNFPVWLQFFVKVLFQVINRSGTGVITKDELSSFYSSVLGLDSQNLEAILNSAYKAMTSNGDHSLHFKSYKLCFANYLFGRYPNGPGQYVMGASPNCASSVLFPIDYSALNTEIEDLEQYTPQQKSNRLSIIV